MSLTSGHLIALLIVLAVAVFVITVLDWPRAAHRGAQWLLRAGRLVVLNLLIVLLCGAALNDQYLFYTSWADLFTSPGAGRVTTSGTTEKLLSAPVSGRRLRDLHSPATLPALPNPGQTLQRYTVRNPTGGAPVVIDVYLPPHYDPASTKKYPVLLGLHGYPGVPGSFFAPNIAPVRGGLEAAGKIAPSILVVPQIDIPTTVDTECVNGGPGEPQTDTWLSSDVPEWIVSHFHVKTDRFSWATVGYSFGGWCAVSLTMRHPDIFGGAISFQGYFRPDFDAGYTPVDTSLAPYDLVRKEQHDPVPVAIYAVTSKQDGLSYPSTAQFIVAARAPTTLRAVVLPTGGHRFRVWEPYTGPAFEWLAQTLPGFRA